MERTAEIATGDASPMITQPCRTPKVDLLSLLDFIFPKSLQHPLSTGRLYAFAMHGPLDSSGRLRAGRNGERVVTPWEMDTMCLQFEREDILKVYVSEGRPLFVLSEAQKEELIAQADSHLKTAKGPGYRRQITLPETKQLLSSLPRDEAGLVSFHDVQRRILEYRSEQIARFKLIFPNLVIKVAGQSRPSPVSDALCGTATEGSRRMRARERLNATPGQGTETVHSVHNMAGPREARCIGGAGSICKDRRGNGSDRKAKFSADVAPAEMFVHDIGFTPAGMAKHTNKLLSTRAFKVCHIADGNNPGLTQNVRLIREDRAPVPGRSTWDQNSCLRAQNVGAHVRSARSSTTAKRKA